MVPQTYVISDLKGDNFGTFYERQLQKNCNPKLIRVEKVIKIKGEKLYVKWKGYDISFNSWIDEKDTV